jgi:hypothetical protein
VHIVSGGYIIKELGRWIIRRDAEASGTRMAGWIDRMSQIFSTVVGVTIGIEQGIILFFSLWVLRMIVGYADINYFRVHAYGIHYLSEKAPSNVLVLNGKRHRKSSCKKDVVL